MPAHNLYDRQESETDRAWEAFQIFLSLGPTRSPGKTAKQMGISRPTVNRWLYSFDWKNRAEAFDQDNNPEIVFLSTPEASPLPDEALPVPAEASPVKSAGKKLILAGNPWDRQPGEGDEAWVAFVIYRDLGAERTLNKVRKELGKSDRICEKWSSAHQWVFRSAEWDKHLDQEIQKATIQEKIDYVRLREQNLIRAEQLRAQLLDAHFEKLKKHLTNPVENPYRLSSVFSIAESGKIDQECIKGILAPDEPGEEIGEFIDLVKKERQRRNGTPETE